MYIYFVEQKLKNLQDQEKITLNDAKGLTKKSILL